LLQRTLWGDGHCVAGWGIGARVCQAATVGPMGGR